MAVAVTSDRYERPLLSSPGTRFTTATFVTFGAGSGPGDEPAIKEVPDQTGGDDGTRTHDPLLANLTAAYVGERHGAYGLISGAPGAA